MGTHNTYISSAGTATSDRVCTACGSGYTTTTNQASCTAWTSCSAGQYVSSAGTSTTDRACAACASGYTTTTNAASCASWSTCAAGTYISSAGTATSDRVCTACASGYTTTTNQASCTAWSTCSAGSYISTAGTATSDRVCTTCPVGTTTSSSNETSCAAAGPNGLTDCGPSANESCSTTIALPGGTYQHANPYGAPYSATVSGFRLDKYEITVGRFRQFVTAVVNGWQPTSGSGKHTHLNSGSGLLISGEGFERGWDPNWTGGLHASLSSWGDDLACASSYEPLPTWTSSVGANEGRPINCASWAQVYAFCIWDGGFLPSDAEWEYAAVGGSEQRTYPWGGLIPGTDANLSVYGCFF